MAMPQSSNTGLASTPNWRFPELARFMNRVNAVSTSHIANDDRHHQAIPDSPRTTITKGLDIIVDVTSAPASSINPTGWISIRHYETFVAEHMPDTGHEVEDFKVFTWRLTNWLDRKKKLISPEFKCGGHLWRIVLVPFENMCPLRNDHVFVYLDHVNNKEMSEDWHACTQFALVISNPNNPRVYTVNSASHRFTPKKHDLGFQFNELRKLFAIQEPNTRPIIENGSADITVFVRVLKDPIGLLWHKFLEFDSKKETGYLGLNNQDVSCMNVVLQALFCIHQFRRAIYRIPIKGGNSTECVALALQRIVHRLQTSDQAVDTSELAKRFGWGQLRSMNRPQVNGTISRLFAGTLKHYFKYTTINYAESEDRMFYGIELKVKGLKNLRESFKDYLAEVPLNPNKQYHFGLGESKQGISFISFPPVLYIRLKRYCFGPKCEKPKVNCRYEYPSEIDMAEFLDESVDRSQPWTYNLHGVLVYYENQNDGHHFAFIKPKKYGQWLQYDDDHITPVMDHEVFENNFGGKLTNRVITTAQGRQIKTAKGTRNVYGLIYIRVAEMDTLLAPLTEDEIPAHLKKRLQEESMPAEIQKHNLEEQDLYVTVKVMTDENFRDHQGSGFATFDDKNHSPAGLPTFQVLKQESYSTFKARVAQKLHLSKTNIRLWALINRTNKTIRPDIPIIENDPSLTLGLVWNNLARQQNQLHFYLEFVQDSAKPPDPDSIIIFLKYFDVMNQLLKGVGKITVWQEQIVSDLLPIINEKMKWALETPLNLYEEIKPDMIEQLNLELTFSQSEIQDGDIICFQMVMSDKEMQDIGSLGMPTNPIQFYEFLHNSIIISFHPKFNPVDDHHPEFDLNLDKRMDYDEMSAKVGEHLKWDPKMIKFTTTHTSNTLPGIVLTSNPNFNVQEIMPSSQVSPKSIVILYELLEIIAIFSPCIHVDARCVCQARTLTAQSESYNMPLEESQRPSWETICSSPCNCPWRVLLNCYKIYPLLEVVNNPWELFEAIKDWFDKPEKMLPLNQLNQWSSKEIQLLLTIIEHIISVIEPDIKEGGASSSQLSLCFKWLRKIVKKTGVLPSSLIIKDIKQTNKNPIQCGGFADIYKGVYGKDQVALKVIRVTTTIVIMKQSQTEIFHEALHWKYLRHEHIVPFLGITQELFDPLIGLVSPWMSNGSILQYLENNSQADRSILLTHSAMGLSYLHSQTPALVHGDIKAANILVDDDGKARLTDFGLISISETQHMQTTSTMSGGGSLRWMAPELVDPSRDGVTKSRSSDIFALGMTIIEIFTGLPPFSIKNDAQVLLAIITGNRPDRPDNKSLASPLSDKLWEIAQRCWDTDPEKRPSAWKLLSDLQEISG